VPPRAINRIVSSRQSSQSCPSCLVRNPHPHPISAFSFQLCITLNGETHSPEICPNDGPTPFSTPFFRMKAKKVSHRSFFVELIE
jgi:hypothetical protein